MWGINQLHWQLLCLNFLRLQPLNMLRLKPQQMVLVKSSVPFIVKKFEILNILLNESLFEGNKKGVET
jgi:hypothetical protein